ncbi:hypothetical protein CEXT_112851 [Caerostris extrusa]|uniref:Uncharacterized protein n=1 Tax=Caerostris extrusa TaxID=172846 RepID=A0AAV4QBU6_CAEEX|nr:hypothetical protein CEXT_112851 [Caerostris extrusa]
MGSRVLFSLNTLFSRHPFFPAKKGQSCGLFTFQKKEGGKNRCCVFFYSTSVVCVNRQQLSVTSQAARAPFRSAASSLTCADAAPHRRMSGGGRKECIIPIQLGRSPVYTRH